jgi:hypothetical protein
MPIHFTPPEWRQYQKMLDTLSSKFALITLFAVDKASTIADSNVRLLAICI